MARAKPRVITTSKPLPFEALEPGEFERMGLWLVEAEGYLRPQHFGEAGSDRGIDILACKADGKGEHVWCFQCKRYQKIGAAALKAEVDKYEGLADDHGWPQPVGVVFITNARVTAQTRTAVMAYCQARGYLCEFWARTELDMRVKRHRRIVHEFFDAIGPPPTADALHQLPQPPRDFTGREQDIAEFMAELEKRGAVISCRGMGGVGKTALALVLAQRLTDRYPDAQVFLNLRGVPQQESVTKQEPVTTAEAMAHVIRAFHPDFKPPDDRNQLEGHYHSVLAGRRVLLLMDNALDRPQVEPLIPPPTCLMLVTTRQRFTLPGLYWKDLDTLPPEDARDLVLEIAPRIGEAADEMAEVCGRLPLAIVTAASALAERADLDPGGYVARLRKARKRLELVDASLSLSYDLLDAGTGRRFAALAVFPAGFDAGGAAAVWDIPPDEAREVLGELVRYSLVEYEEAAGRHHLHDLVRVFADSRLAKRERAGAEKRHAAHYEGVLRRAKETYKQGGDAVVHGLALFDAEWENIRAGQAWAAGHTAKDRAAAALCNAYPDAGVYCLSLRLHPRERIRWFEAALTAARELKDRGGEGVHLGNLGNAYAALGEVRRAIEFHEQALAIDRETGDRRGEGQDLGNLGLAYAALGEARRAIEFHEQALAIDRETGDKRGEGNALWNMALAYEKMGDRREAVSLAAASLEIFEAIEDPNAEKVRRALQKWKG